MRRPRTSPVLLALLGFVVMAMTVGGVADLARSASARPRTATKRSPRARSGARAPAKPLEGLIVRIDDGEFVVNLGRNNGLREGMSVRLYRTIRTTHPVTRRALRDRFPVGTTTVTEVADRLSIMRPEGPFLGQVRVGDPVVVIPAASPDSKGIRGGGSASAGVSAAANRLCLAQAQKRCPPSRSCPACPKAQPKEAYARRADAVFRSSLGRTLTERIVLWRRWLRSWPETPLTAQVQAEVDLLHSHVAGLQLADRTRRDLQGIADLRKRIHHAPLERIFRGEPAWVVLSAADWSNVRDVRIYVRAKGGGAYKLLRPASAGKLHRRVRLPDALVRAPGFDYAIAVDRGTEAEVWMTGDAKNPKAVEVLNTSEEEDDTAGRTTFRWTTDYVDFNRLRGDDAYLAARVNLRYRVQTGALYAFDIGYGFLNGQGGTVAENDVTDPVTGEATARRGDTLNSRNSSFKHAWLGTEWALRPGWHLLVSLVVGLDSEGLDTGIELATRIGDERGTNLLLGVATLADVGRAATIDFGTRLVTHVPMHLTFEVTNRPVGEDIGIRLGYQADLELSTHVALTGRIGYALRTIAHAGPSFGGGLTINW